jgi:hypothetical protein
VVTAARSRFFTNEMFRGSLARSVNGNENSENNSLAVQEAG